MVSEHLVQHLCKNHNKKFTLYWVKVDNECNCPGKKKVTFQTNEVISET